MNTTDFCKEHGITCTAKRVDANPNWNDGGTYDHWRVTLKFGKARMSTYFSQGIGHDGKAPKADSVLDCIVSDGYPGQTFEEFCSDFDYSEDSIKAKKTWQASQRNLRRLVKFLGDDLSDKLRDEVERL
jgi:hypothetical protein